MQQVVMREGKVHKMKLEEEYVVIMALTFVVCGLTIALAAACRKLKAQEEWIKRQTVRMAIQTQQLQRVNQQAMWN